MPSGHAVFSEPGYSDIYQDTYDFGTPTSCVISGKKGGTSSITLTASTGFTASGTEGAIRTGSFTATSSFTAEGVGQHPRRGGRLLPIGRPFAPLPPLVRRTGTVTITGTASTVATGNPGKAGDVHVAAICVTAATGDGTLFNDDDELILLGVI